MQSFVVEDDLSSVQFFELEVVLSQFSTFQQKILVPIFENDACFSRNGLLFTKKHLIS